MQHAEHGKLQTALYKKVSGKDEKMNENDFVRMCKHSDMFSDSFSIEDARSLFSKVTVGTGQVLTVGALDTLLDEVALFKAKKAYDSNSRGKLPTVSSAPKLSRKGRMYTRMSDACLPALALSGTAESRSPSGSPTSKEKKKTKKRQQLQGQQLDRAWSFGRDHEHVYVAGVVDGPDLVYMAENPWGKQLFSPTNMETRALQRRWSLEGGTLLE